MKTDLIVTLPHVARVKELGARYDMARKTWYCPDGVDLMLFTPWLPKQLRKWKSLKPAGGAARNSRRGKAATTVPKDDLRPVQTRRRARGNAEARGRKTSGGT